MTIRGIGRLAGAALLGAMLASAGLSGCKDESAVPVRKAAYGNFCHSLNLDGRKIAFALTLGSGSDEVRLTAPTNDCATPLGGACRALPVGRDVPYTLYDWEGEAVLSGVVELEEDQEYYFLLDLDEVGDLEIFNGAIAPTERCEELMCSFGVYNSVTCHEADVCNWIGDGFCDSYCEEVSSQPLDDTEDCTVDCEQIEDYDACILCLCGPEVTACEESRACLDLNDCIFDCEEDACVEACSLAYEDGIRDYNALIDCRDIECSEY